MPVLILLAPALGGCEYPNDRDPAGVAASPPPSDSSPESRGAPHSQQAYIDALSELLGPPGHDGLPYAAGNTASWVADISAGQYFLTAACVAAPGAELTVQSGSAEPERTSFRCGMGKVMYLDHKGGAINAHVVPPPESPYGYTGLRLDRVPAQRGSTAAVPSPFPFGTADFGIADPELKAELERNMGAVELMLADIPAGAGGAAGGISGHSAAGGGLTYNGVLTGAGTYTVTAACTGALEAQLVVTSRGASAGSEVIDVPCGEPVTRQVQLGTGPVTAHLVSPDEDRLHKAAAGAVRILDPAP